MVETILYWIDGAWRIGWAVLGLCLLVAFLVVLARLVKTTRHSNFDSSDTLKSDVTDDIIKSFREVLQSGELDADIERINLRNAKRRGAK